MEDGAVISSSAPSLNTAIPCIQTELNSCAIQAGINLKPTCGSAAQARAVFVVGTHPTRHIGIQPARLSGILAGGNRLLRRTTWVLRRFPKTTSGMV
jgi:hypothetical protein